jgi:hypothetical protein
MRQCLSRKLREEVTCLISTHWSESSVCHPTCPITPITTHKTPPHSFSISLTAFQRQSKSLHIFLELRPDGNSSWYSTKGQSVGFAPWWRMTVLGECVVSCGEYMSLYHSQEMLMSFTIQQRKMVLSEYHKHDCNLCIGALTPSSAVNFLRSSSANAPGAPSGMMNISYQESDELAIHANEVAYLNRRHCGYC